MFGRESRYAMSAMALAIAAGLLTFIYLNSVKVSEDEILRTKLAAFKNRETVTTARRDISAGAEISAADVITEKITSAYVVDGALHRREEAVGRTALVDIYKGEQLIRGRFGDPESVPGASRTISHGKMALALAVDDVSGVAGGVRPGDHVNVFVTYDDSSDAELLFGGLLVRGVGGTYPYGGSAPSKSTKESVGSGFGTTSSNNAGSDLEAVILEVTESQAKSLTFASEKGKIRLGLLPAGEGQRD